MARKPPIRSDPSTGIAHLALIEVGEEVLYVVGRMSPGLIKFIPPILHPEPQTLPQLQEKFTAKKLRIKLADDNRRVVKLSDVADCVEKHITGGNVAADFLKALATAPFVEGKDADDLIIRLTNRLMKCIRKKVLRQDKPRFFVKKEYSTRKLSTNVIS